MKIHTHKCLNICAQVLKIVSINDRKKIKSNSCFTSQKKQNNKIVITNILGKFNEFLFRGVTKKKRIV